MNQNHKGKNLSDESQQSPLAKTVCGGLLDHAENFPSAMYQ
jgi:hypothetical protein